MANNIHYELDEADKLRNDDYPPEIEEHLQKRPFAANENAGAQERMRFMHDVFGNFVHEHLQRFVQQRRADPTTQNAPNGYWEKMLTADTINRLFDDILSNFKIRGTDLQTLKLGEIWKKVVEYTNRILDRACYLWSPRFQMPVGAFGVEERRAERNEAEGKGKPKKCRKCGLYKH